MKPIFQKLVPSNEIPFLLNKIELNRFEVPYHFHPEIELTYILESDGRRVIGNNISTYKAGDLVLLGKNIPHSWYNVANNNGRSRAIVVQFDEGFLGQTFFRKTGLNHLGELLYEAQRGIFIGGRSKKLIAQKLEGLFSLNTFDRVLTLLAVLDIIEKSDDRQFLNIEGYAANFSKKDCDRINAICLYVTEHFAEDIRLDYVAREIGKLTVSAFCNYFRNKMDRTFTQFVNEIRIEEAKKIILTTNKDISEIAYECGFQSKSNFYKQFQRINGKSPTQYRKTFKQDYSTCSVHSMQN
ncbi:AraC family transcriptional regulator [Maribacter ulvicola]|uniref:Transcriptional regulator, AraC family n=1 Tax=Maribacter ulvicola TaxID=228959 RepID=A0A1N6X9Q6_9FLAO|nr:AraC family transcriptional regulator [Maribacter ulvicola]SIQ98981.1 transcriptional regulator, AraC family [Maribacter ulvicola]